MRNDRNQLEHEAEILNQRVQQESQNLKDNLKGMFDDRKMDVRMEQKEMESRVSIESPFYQSMFFLQTWFTITKKKKL